MSKSGEDDVAAARGGRALGRLNIEGGVGVVLIRVQIDADQRTVWSAVSDPGRLARWWGHIEGDLRGGGELRANVFFGGPRLGRVDLCEPARRLRVTLRDPDPQPGQPDGTTVEIRLDVVEKRTLVSYEERGAPPPLLAAYGAGGQIHIEDLIAHLDGQEPGDRDARWSQLFADYQSVAVDSH